MTDAAGHPTPFRLEYHVEAIPPARRKWRVASLGAMLPALIVPFVPFACDATPVLVTAEGPPAPPWGSSGLQDLALWLTSLPFLLAFPIMLWKVRRLAAPCASNKSERIASIGLGATCTLTVAGMIALLAPAMANLEEAVFLTVPAVALLLGALVFVRLIARRSHVDALVSIALLTPYSANAAFSLLCWHAHAQAGWYLTVLPAAAALSEMIATGVTTPGGSGRRDATTGRWSPPPG